MHSCFDLKLNPSDNFGWVFVSKCPAYLNRTSQLVRACEHPNPSDTFQSLPVLDKKTNINYKNYFCARCNGATNVTFWVAQHGCDDVRFAGDFNLSSYMQKNCNKDIYLWTFSPPKNATARYCALRKHNRWCNEANSSKHVNWKIVKNLCEAYYFPVCQWKPIGPDETYNNPHCLLCGVRFIIDSRCSGGCPERVGLYPQGLPIVFDFSSTSEIKIEAAGQIILVIPDRCSEHQVYDPFSRICRYVAPVPKPLMKRKTLFFTNSTSNVTFTQNCTFVQFTIAELKIFSNRSVFIKPNNRVYPRTRYILTENGIALCTNFSRNFTKVVESVTEGKKSVHSFAFRVITYVGGALSILSLLILIAVYVRIKKFKRIPGKIVMSLSCALLGFKGGFFLNGLTWIPALCSAVAVVLHYFLLASFTWMNVLAINMVCNIISTGK